MMIRCCIFILIFAGIFTCTNAQQQPDLNPNNAIAPEEFLRFLTPPKKVEAEVNLFTRWQNGAVFLTQGRFASGVNFNYDVLNNTLMVLFDGEEFSLNPIAVDSILITNSSYVLVNPIVINNTDSDLLLLRFYNSSHSSLFSKTSAEVLEGDTKTSSTTELVYEAKNDIRIDQDRDYFILNKTTGEFNELQGKTKELKKWENGDQIVTFVKSQNLDLKKEAHLIQVVQYFEQLTYTVID